MGQSLHTKNGLTAEGFKFYAAKAKAMTVEALNFAVQDCHECIENGINENRYKDESSCYCQELQKREPKKPKAPKPPLKFFEDELHFPICERCARERKSSPFEKTRPVRELVNPTEPCYWCEAEPTKQEESNVTV